MLCKYAYAFIIFKFFAVLMHTYSMCMFVSVCVHAGLFVSMCFYVCIHSVNEEAKCEAAQ